MQNRDIYSMILPMSSLTDAPCFTTEDSCLPPICRPYTPSRFDCRRASPLFRATDMAFWGPMGRRSSGLQAGASGRRVSRTEERSGAGAGQRRDEPGPASGRRRAVDRPTDKGRSDSMAPPSWQDGLGESTSFICHRRGRLSRCVGASTGRCRCEEVAGNVTIVRVQVSLVGWLGPCRWDSFFDMDMFEYQVLTWTRHR